MTESCVLLNRFLLSVTMRTGRAPNLYLILKYIAIVDGAAALVTITAILSNEIDPDLRQ